MANVLINNVYMIDSEMGMGVPILGPNTSSWLDDAYVNQITLWGSGTTSALELVYAENTGVTAVILSVNSPNGLSGVVSTSFATPQRFTELRIKTLTAGTAWIYIS